MDLMTLKSGWECNKWMRGRVYWFCAGVWNRVETVWFGAAGTPVDGGHFIHSANLLRAQVVGDRAREREGIAKQ